MAIIFSDGFDNVTSPQMQKSWRNTFKTKKPAKSHSGHCRLQRFESFGIILIRCALCQVCSCITANINGQEVHHTKHCVLHGEVVIA